MKSISNSWPYLAGVFTDYAIVTVHYEDGTEATYRGLWSMVEGEPQWQGTPTEVEIEITTEIRERMLAAMEKGVNSSQRRVDAKRGRVISTANENRLRDASETLDELAAASELSRTQRSVLRQVISILNEVLGQVAPEEEEAKRLAVDSKNGTAKIPVVSPHSAKTRTGTVARTAAAIRRLSK